MSPAGEQLAMPTPGRRSLSNLGMTGAGLRAVIRQLARHNGWLGCHIGWSKGSEPGFPGLVLVRARQQRVIFAGLKLRTGKTTGALVRRDGLPDADVQTSQSAQSDYLPASRGRRLESLACARVSSGQAIS